MRWKWTTCRRLMRNKWVALEPEGSPRIDDMRTHLTHFPFHQSLFSKWGLMKLGLLINASKINIMYLIPTQILVSLTNYYSPKEMLIHLYRSAFFTLYLQYQSAIWKMSMYFWCFLFHFLYPQLQRVPKAGIHTLNNYKGRFY